MSKGTIILNEDFSSSDYFKKAVAETFINDIMPKLETDVDDKEWQHALAQLQNSLSQTNSRIESIKIGEPLELQVKVCDNPQIDVGKAHKTFPKLLNVLSQHLNVYLVGPAGSGKTYAAKKCAEALGVPFYFTGAIANEYKLTGFKNAQGEYVGTEFRKAYENGGVFLFDEIDASFPQAVLAFNAALANDFMDFPDKQVKMHPNFYCIAAANTIGQGADRQYVGRNQLDAASLDRFVFIDWEYDENLEISLSGDAEWAKYVQLVRKVISDNKIRCVISPRASMFGAKLLAAGIERSTIENMVLWKGLDEASVNKIKDEVCHEESSRRFKSIKDSFDKQMIFEDSSSELTKTHKNACRQLHNFLKNNNLNIILKGHCSKDEESNTYNYRTRKPDISQERVNAVLDYLCSELELSEDRIDIKNVGSSECDDSHTNVKNRRVTVELQDRHDK